MPPAWAPNCCWVRLNELDKARYLYEAVREARAAPWAKLGIARVELESGQLQQATRTLESLIGEQPTYADAYDVMGRVQVEQGDMTAALETYRTATELTPASISRLQKQGMLAFYMGEAAEATDALERTVRIGISSKMFDCQTLVLLVLLHHDKRDTKAFVRACSHIERAVEKRPESARLRRFLETARILQALIERQVGNAMRAATTLAAQIRDEDFDFEAAANLLAALSRMSGTEIQLPEAEGWVMDLARRFCASKASTDMLCMACAPYPPFEAIVRSAHQTHHHRRREGDDEQPERCARGHRAFAARARRLDTERQAARHGRAGAEPPRRQDRRQRPAGRRDRWPAPPLLHARHSGRPGHQRRALLGRADAAPLTQTAVNRP